MSILDSKVETYVFPDMVLYDKCFYYISSIMRTKDVNKIAMLESILDRFNGSFYKLTKKELFESNNMVINNIAFSSMMREEHDTELQYDLSLIDMKLPVMQLATAVMMFNKDLFLGGKLNKQITFVPQDELDEKLLKMCFDGRPEDIKIISVDTFMEKYKSTLYTHPFTEVITSDIKIALALADIIEKNDKLVKVTKQTNICFPDIFMCHNIKDEDIRKLKKAGIEILYYNI